MVVMVMTVQERAAHVPVVTWHVIPWTELVLVAVVPDGQQASAIKVSCCCYMYEIKG